MTDYVQSNRRNKRSKVIGLLNRVHPGRLSFEKMHYRAAKRPVVLRCNCCGAYFRQRVSALLQGAKPVCNCYRYSYRKRVVPPWELPDDFKE